MRVFLHFIDTKGDNEPIKLYTLVMHSVREGRKDSGSEKKILISVLKWPQALNLYLELRENASLPIVFFSSH